MGDQEYELMMQALVTLVREFTNVGNRADESSTRLLRAFNLTRSGRVFANDCERLRVLQPGTLKGGERLKRVFANDCERLRDVCERL